MSKHSIMRTVTLVHGVLLLMLGTAAIVSAWRDWTDLPEKDERRR
ncbi:hypothetical protein [Schleiferilactobacillus shenzhenensis]|nr:hypothetical protein [Schleiferilactobacillus shenzhenensis]